MQSTTQPSGPNLAGIVQEELSNFVVYNGASWPSTGWGPSGPSANFYMAGGQIYDWCIWQQVAASWAHIPIGTTLLSWTQSLQLTWVMICASGSQGTMIAPLGSLNWKMVKVSSTSYTITGQ